MQLNPKFKIGDTAWCSVRPENFNFDDRLPVVEVRIDAIRHSGIYYGEGEEKNNTNLDYRCREMPDGWQELSFHESELFATQEDAEAHAANRLRKTLERNNAENESLQRMLDT
ncbi:hypothetical protein [Neptuniibacter sp. QD37_11]|uniref:hypothetical protein n=1 Tax=Neptuniibacter sp. QD37_11 TaxID=3398209 RepID=UPI0039F53D01